MFVHDGLNKCSLQGVNLATNISHKATLTCVVVTAFKNTLIAKYLHFAWTLLVTVNIHI